MLSFSEFAQIWCLEQKVGKAPHYLPRMHAQICAWLDTTSRVENQRRLLMAYRHAGKSYLIGLYVAWRLYLDCNYTCLVVSASGELAEQNSAFIRQVIEAHPLCAHLRPDNDQQWQRTKFNVRRSTVSNIRSVTCRSMSGKITGFHGEEVVLDDSETSDNADTEGARRKIARTLEELNTTANSLLAIGTPHHEESIYKFMIARGYENLILPVYDDFGQPRNAEMGHDEAWVESKRSNISLPKYQSQYELKFTKGYEAQYDGNLLIAFAGEIKIGPVDDFTDDPRRMGKPTFWIVKEGAEDIEVYDIRAYYDPATGKRHRDNSALAVCAKDEAGNVYVLDCVVLPPIDMDADYRMGAQFAKIVDVCRRNYCNTVIVESNFSVTIGGEFRRWMKDRNSKLRLREQARASKVHKDTFIPDMIEPLMRAGRLIVHERCFRDFKNELEDFPNGQFDDRLDAVAGAIFDLNPSRTDLSKTEYANKTSFQRGGVYEFNTYTPGGL
ncbi:phage terminase large subunit [Ferrovibrio sp.]|uniref:phage terminase large subunit n=1 Tax=Ferrovibrio sp. TaxID=1917215 RepID=UPI0035B479F8